MATETLSDTEPKGRHTVGMDLSAPFGVYVDCRKVASYPTEAQAQQHYDRLLARCTENSHAR